MNIEKLQQWVGKQETTTDRIGAWPARALAAALNLEALPAPGDALPAAWHWLPSVREACVCDVIRCTMRYADVM